MNRPLIILALFSFATLTAYGAALDTGDWYQYNGSSTLHTYAVKFPTDWKTISISDAEQGFAPKDEKEDKVYYLIQEFEGQSFTQAINFYVKQGNNLVNISDILFATSKEDLVAKQAIYHNSEMDADVVIIFVKRGSLILALKGDDINYPDISANITNSFKFTDSWHQYLDFSDNYSFIFPASYQLDNLANGVLVATTQTVFSVVKYEDTSLDEVADDAANSDEKLLKQDKILFHGIENAIRAEYRDTPTNKKFSRIFVGRGNTYFGLTDVNLESNFPHSDYYDEYILEMLESFEFFEVEGDEEYYTFKNFPDVRDNHPNAQSVNALTGAKVINGYPDGTFKPDGEINRAELTKLVVAAQVQPDPDKFKNCFPDVKEEWFALYICYAKEEGWVEGYPNGQFRPELSINRVEALKIILKAIFGGVPGKDILRDTSVLDIDTDQWYGKYFIFSDNKKLLDKQHIEDTDEGYFYFPDKNMTRKEVAETIYRAQKLK